MLGEFCKLRLFMPSVSLSRTVGFTTQHLSTTLPHNLTSKCELEIGRGALWSHGKGARGLILTHNETWGGAPAHWSIRTSCFAELSVQKAYTLIWYDRWTSSYVTVLGVFAKFAKSDYKASSYLSVCLSVCLPVRRSLGITRLPLD